MLSAAACASCCWEVVLLLMEVVLLMMEVVLLLMEMVLLQMEMVPQSLLMKMVQGGA